MENHVSMDRLKRAVPSFRFTLLIVLTLLLAVPLAEAPNETMLRGRRAQELLDELRRVLSIDREVQLAVVAHHPFVFAVEPLDRRKSRFRLSMEVGFLHMLEEDELRAALAHELGHVWIFTHHPFMQTERLANSIAQRVARRISFERLYLKLWKYEGASGVAMEQLLGADPGPHLRSKGETP
jgi:hypothetical protein